MRPRSAALLTAVLALSSCSGANADVTILAASSLTNILPDATAVNGVSISTSYLGSASLATQIEQGRQADLVITANRTTMDRIVATGLVAGEPIELVQNRLVIAVPTDNPGKIEALADLGSSDLKIAACAPEVPCGALAAEIAADRGVELAIDSFDPNVRAVITRVETAAVDAGLVYATDAAAADVATIEIDPGAEFVTSYFVASLVDASPESIDVLGQLLGDGRSVLIDGGFLAP